MTWSVHERKGLCVDRIGCLDWYMSRIGNFNEKMRVQFGPGNKLSPNTRGTMKRQFQSCQALSCWVGHIKAAIS